MSKKQLNSEIVLNELKQGSAFFPEKKRVDGLTSSDESKQRTFERSLNGTNQGSKKRTVEPTNHSSNEPTKQRTKVRHTFDIFADQLQGLHQYQLECIQDGTRKPKLGDMVQVALDEYLAKQGIASQAPNTEHSNERS